MKKNNIFVNTIIAVIFFICVGIFVLILFVNEENLSDNHFTQSLEEKKRTNNVVAHSMGSIDGFNSTNSYESFIASYNRGIRVFDSDLRFTSDNILVLRHEWTDKMGTSYDGRIPNFNEFINSRIHQKYTPLSFDDLIKLMIQYKDIYIAVDMKEDLNNGYIWIINRLKEMNSLNNDILDRFIITFYGSDYNIIKKVYPFKNWTLGFYSSSSEFNENKAIKFCVDNDIKNINIWTTLVNDKFIKKCKKAGIEVSIAVVDKEHLKDYVKKYRIYGIVSNDVNEDYFDSIE